MRTTFSVRFIASDLLRSQCCVVGRAAASPAACWVSADDQLLQRDGRDVEAALRRGARGRRRSSAPSTVTDGHATEALAVDDLAAGDEGVDRGRVADDGRGAVADGIRRLVHDDAAAVDHEHASR